MSVEWVHFLTYTKHQSMTGEKFELHVHDGNQWTAVNQAVMPSLSSGHEFHIRFRYSAGRAEARVKFLVMDDRGQSVS